MAITHILEGLDPDQRKAATAERNAVVAAGAGSGKTKVLAARYAWLVMEKAYPVESILALTFTNKAASEMYGRIYTLLLEQRDSPLAREAVKNFHKARIGTLDSFCAAIGRTAARQYGISADFRIDEAAVRELALKAALPFVLDRRDNRALSLLIAERKIKTVAEELFADMLIKYSPLGNPLDFQTLKELQGRELLERWRKGAARAASLVRTLREALGETAKGGKTLESLREILAGPVEAPDIQPLLEQYGLLPAPRGSAGLGQAPEDALRRAVAAYFDWLFRLKSVPRRGGEALALIKECLGELKEQVYEELELTANTALQGEIIAAVFPLADEFQRLCNRQKREAGVLTFHDAARLAVDALIRYPDIRALYKRDIRALMIDEFQDNNRLQRDLIYLLAEAEDRAAPGLPGHGELCPDKLFFVGDEKQSIYRFRGADVSVFRSLSDAFAQSPGGINLRLPNNYRSTTELIRAFNRIFGGISGTGAEALPEAPLPAVFLPGDMPRDAFEAAYTPAASPREALAGSAGAAPSAGDGGAVNFYLIDEDRLAEQDQRLSTQELEGAFIAWKIRRLIDSNYLVTLREGPEIIRRPCVYTDFAVLQRSYTHQYFLEKHCKAFGIPYTADRPSALFQDAPVNDLYNLLRLLAYPEDRIAYGALIRSPFMRLSDEVFTVCMLAGDAAPFDEALDGRIPPEELERFQYCRRRYQRAAEAASRLPLTELAALLWYQEGCRYETLWSAEAQPYAGLFDLFFELARDAQERGKTLTDFLDYLEGLLNQEERLEDLPVPQEGDAGVRLMSIHKSKGLEFPVVFLYCAGGRVQHTRNDKAVYYSETWGLTINIPPADELPNRQGGNLFFQMQQAEEARKQAAELRRLLYVAMTRAESALYVTAALPKQTKEEQEQEAPRAGEPGDGPLRRRLIQLREKRQGQAASFLDLLLPVLAAPSEAAAFGVHPIPPWTREAIAALRRPGPGGAETPAMAEAAERARPWYRQARRVPDPDALVETLRASDLHWAAADGERGGKPRSRPGWAVDLDIDRIMEKAGLLAEDFGTIVHSFLEARLSNRKARIPPGIEAKLSGRGLRDIEEAARIMAGGFCDSPLGRSSAAAAYREPEFPILTLAPFQGRHVSVIGQIDLVFAGGALEPELGGPSEGVRVVDFKTDREERANRHLGQLAVYSRAAGDIFGKPARSWLYYLRSGNYEELTVRIKEVDIEAMVYAALTRPHKP
ncbi:MAG: UvrD-helicase domain-containing protein [Treponema sp.]|jgi:ATP-dependent helicase/nuclease subunit A|nr:UvrD-helicase domain-containing protein [Treponema sp.]